MKLTEEELVMQLIVAEERATRLTAELKRALMDVKIISNKLTRLQRKRKIKKNDINR